LIIGDTAEEVYQKVAPLGNTTRFRFRRPKGVKFGTFPEGIRHMPDFVTASYMVEVMGLGRDRLPQPGTVIGAHTRATLPEK
jgi:hypothetical protein